MILRHGPPFTIEVDDFKAWALLLLNTYMLMVQKCPPKEP
jgi:hypothetical protein